MAVNIQVGLPAYNKPPLPDKEPSQTLYPIKLTVTDGHQAWVSVPQPDKLHLTGDVLPEHFTKLDLKPDEYGPSLMDALAAEQAGPVFGTHLQGKIYRAVQVGFGTAETPVFFKLMNAKTASPAVHRLSMHLNPRALGQEGLYELLDRLHKASGYSFKVGAFLAQARINRLDVAVDIIGLGVPELLVSAKTSAKHVHYYGSDGVLETVAIHKKQALGKGGLGPLLVMAYDKRRERLTQGEKPPFGPAEVTRVEITKTRFGPKAFGLAAVPDLTNPFVTVRVGSVRAAGSKNSWQWLRYVEARRGAGPSRAAFVLNLKPKTATEFAGRYADHPSDVLDMTTLWQHWASGIAATGLNYLVEAAEQLSAGVPFPPDQGI